MNGYFSRARDHAEEAERLVAAGDIDAAQVHATLANAYAVLAAGRGG